MDIRKFFVKRKSTSENKSDAENSSKRVKSVMDVDKEVNSMDVSRPPGLESEDSEAADDVDSSVCRARPARKVLRTKSFRSQRTSLPSHQMNNNLPSKRLDQSEFVVRTEGKIDENKECSTNTREANAEETEIIQRLTDDENVDKSDDEDETSKTDREVPSESFQDVEDHESGDSCVGDIQVHDNEGEGTKLQESEHVNDIGCLTDEEGKLDRSKLSDSQKYCLLKNHFKPPPDFVFPVGTFGKQTRKASPSILKEPFVYSVNGDSIWCVSCALFEDITKQKPCEAFVNSGFKNWRKINEKQRSHTANKYHQSAFVTASLFMDTFEKPEKRVSSLLNQELQDRVPTYQNIVALLAQTIHYCGRQGFALRGHREDMEGEGNPGNFLALLKLLAEHNSDLKTLLEAGKVKGTKKCLHHQNELIDLIGMSAVKLKRKTINLEK